MCGKRRGGKRKAKQGRAGVRSEGDLLLVQNNEWVSQPHPTSDLITSWLPHITRGYDTRQAVLYLAFFANTAHQPIILTFPQCYYCTIRKGNVDRQGISKVISLKLTALKCASEGKKKYIYIK